MSSVVWFIRVRVVAESILTVQVRISIRTRLIRVAAYDRLRPFITVTVGVRVVPARIQVPARL